MIEYILFPGRHHMVTRFQTNYLHSILAQEKFKACSIIWAVTSSTHSGTRRNPLPSHRRAALIESVTTLEQLPSLVTLIPDVPPSPGFAHTTIKSAELELDISLTPVNTVVACSTTSVAELYEKLGYEVLPVEAGTPPPRPSLPWEVLEMMVRSDQHWRDIAHAGCVSFYDKYNLEPYVRRVHEDPTVSTEGDLTTTRDYRSYSSAFDDSSERKWSLIKKFIQPGRIVDLGCAAGGLLEQASRDPSLAESDLYGVDISRHLVSEAQHRKAQGFFNNPNTFFAQRNILQGSIFAPSSVNTTVTVALTHEISSYGAGRADLELLAERIYEHTSPGGVWINSDVLAPDEPEQIIHLHLDGTRQPPAELEGMELNDQRVLISSLSPAAKLEQFGWYFPRLSGADFKFKWVSESTAEMTLRDAMEFLYTRDYNNNFLSECHERFCDMTYSDWVELLTSKGFVLDEASGPWRNEWLVENRLSQGAALSSPEGDPIAWPSTHVMLVARKLP